MIIIIVIMMIIMTIIAIGCGYVRSQCAARPRRSATHTSPGSRAAAAPPAGATAPRRARSSRGSSRGAGEGFCRESRRTVPAPCVSRSSAGAKVLRASGGSASRGRGVVGVGAFRVAPEAPVRDLAGAERPIAAPEGRWRASRLQPVQVRIHTSQQWAKKCGYFPFTRGGNHLLKEESACVEPQDFQIVTS